MADVPTSYLRNLPRQARSAARVELLLDVAEEVFEEVGYDAATTNLVASRRPWHRRHALPLVPRQGRAG